MKDTTNVESIETSVEQLEAEWWQPLSCACDAGVEELETAWWQPLSCGCDASFED